MHNNIKQNSYSRYADNRDVISLFSGAMGLDIGLGIGGCRGREARRHPAV